MSTKQQIRKEILGIRRNLSPEYMEKSSLMITEKIINHPEYQEAKWIFCYMDAKGEVQTKYLIEHAWKNGKRVVVPKVEGKEMSFYEITGFSQLETGNFGIMEPVSTCIKVDSKDKKSIMIIPGVAFDQAGNRIGYGGGYYDKYISSHSKMYKMAIAFSVQIVPQIPSEEYDIKMDCIITERGVI